MSAGNAPLPVSDGAPHLIFPREGSEARPHSAIPEWLSLAVLHRYRSLIISIVAASFLVACLYCLLAPRLYVARSTLQIESYDPVLKSTSVEEALKERSREATYLETQLQEMSSLSLADRVISATPDIATMYEQRALGRLGLILGRELEPPSGGYAHSLPVLEEYLKSISIAPMRRSNIVVIEAISPDPSHAATVANAHAAGYLEWLKSSRLEKQSEGLAFLQRQAQGLRERVSDLEREMAEYAESHSIVAVNKDENITVQRMSRLNNLLTDVTARRIDAEHAAAELERTLNRDNAGADDIAIQRIREELARREAEYHELSSKFTDKYPRVIQIRSEIAQLKRSIVTQRGSILEGLKARAEAARSEEEKLRQELENQKSLAFELSRKEVQFNSLGRELESSRELLQSVLKQINETGLLLQSSASNVTILDPASTPSKARYPRVFLILAGALVFGALAGLIGAGMLARLDDSVRVPDEIPATVGIPCIGAIPSFGEGESKAAVIPSNDDAPLPPEVVTTSRVLDGDVTGSPVAEAYRSLRTALFLSRAGGAPRVIAVTSPQPGEGKTITALNLGAVLARSGSRVVVVDADMRRPAIARYAGVSSRESGLSRVLSGQQDLSSAIIAGITTNLDIIPSGPCPPNPVELLGNNEFGVVINELKDLYDLVLIDTPPVMPVTDGELVARIADGVLLVARSGSTPKGALRTAKSRIELVGGRILGVVLNDLSLRERSYYRTTYAGYSSTDLFEAA